LNLLFSQNMACSHRERKMFKKIIVALFIIFTSQSAIIAQEDIIARWNSQGWKTDFSKTTIDLKEVGNIIAADAIPSIDDPKFQLATDETEVKGNEPVVAFEYNGIARAYPLRYLMWHEIVNDVIDDLPIAVTYCPLCNSSVVFERTLGDDVVTFGTTGKLRFSGLLMYDRGEENWWQQMTGEAIVGVRAGERLKALPSYLISFDIYKERYPNGEILLADRRRASLSGQNPYVNYDSSEFPFLFSGEIPEDIEAMMRIAFVQEPREIAVTLPYLEKNSPFRLGDLEFTWQAGQASALDSGIISEGRDVGNIEVYQILENGEKTPVVYTVTFAFVGRAFIKDLEIIQ